MIHFCALILRSLHAKSMILIYLCPTDFCILTDLSAVLNYFETIQQMSLILLLEGQCPAEFIISLLQTPIPGNI